MIRSVLLLAAGLLLGAIATYQFGPTRTVAVSPYVWQPTEALSPLPAAPAVGTPPLPTAAITSAAVSPVTSAASTRAPKPTPVAGHGAFLVEGVATMTDTRCAAAGPALRRALGANWRGTAVRIWHDGHARDSWLCDWCACRDRPGGPTVIDLPPAIFAAFGEAPGVIAVRVERVPK